MPHLNNLNLLRANFVTYSFKRHMHDYFVIGMIEDGVQKFDYLLSGTVRLSNLTWGISAIFCLMGNEED